jgi:hypothetical protein
MKETQIQEALFVEMFQRVGIQVSTMKAVNDWIEKCDDPDKWYWQITWTQEEEKDFKKWAYKLIKKETKLNKKYTQGAVEMFMLMYGWKNVN